jgi:hypothetical protein
VLNIIYLLGVLLVFKRLATTLVVSVCLVLGLAALAAAASAPRLVITIPKVDQAPVIDGSLDDAAWLNISIKGGKFISDVSSTGTTLVTYPRIVYAGYDANNLYVAYQMFAPDVNAFVTEDAKWFYNDEVELILQPNQAGAVSQYGFVTNGLIGSNGASVEGIKNAVAKDGIRAVIEVAVPWSAIGVASPSIGDKWGIHFSGYQTSPALWMSFSQASGFLKPELMGVAVFGE